MNNPICIVNEVKTLVLILLLLLKIPEKAETASKTLIVKCLVLFVFFFVAEIYPDLAFSLYVFPVLSSWVGKPEPVYLIVIIINCINLFLQILIIWISYLPAWKYVIP